MWYRAKLLIRTNYVQRGDVEKEERRGQNGEGRRIHRRRQDASDVHALRRRRCVRSLKKYHVTHISRLIVDYAARLS